MEEFELAEKNLIEAANGVKKVFGKNSIRYMTMLHNLAAVYITQKDQHKSENVLMDLMEVYILVTQEQFELMDSDERISFIDGHFIHVLMIYNYLAKNQNQSPEFIRKVFEFRLNIKWTFLEKSDSLYSLPADYKQIKISLNSGEAAIEIVRFIDLDQVFQITGNNQLYLFYNNTRYNCT